jgi:hypothetical protein
MVMTEELPALYVVPTPLGHLGDMTQRSIEVLRRVAWVAAEDTRHSGPLLRHYGCTARLLAAHQHNEQSAAQQVIARLANGESVALVVDAGTPAVSDPGARLVARVRAAGYRVVPLPGPCAAIVALSAAGLDDPHFLFYGFLPSKAGQRAEALRGLAHLPYALVFYEAPHRILDAVAALADAFGADTNRGSGARTEQVVRIDPCLSACRSARLVAGRRQPAARRIRGARFGGRRRWTTVPKAKGSSGCCSTRDCRSARPAAWRTRLPGSAGKPCMSWPCD